MMTVEIVKRTKVKKIDLDKADMMLTRELLTGIVREKILGRLHA